MPGAVRLTGRLWTSPALARALAEIVAPPRGAAHHLRRHRGRPRAGDRARAGAAPAAGRPHGPARRPPRGARRGAALPEEAVAPVRPRRGPAAARPAAAPRRTRSTSVLVTMHHIVTDGWSMGVLVRELAALYAAFAAGLPSPLPELPIQYARLRRLAARAGCRARPWTRQLGYWRQQLAGARRRCRRCRPTGRARRCSASAAAACGRRCRPSRWQPCAGSLSEEGATLFMGLLAAFAALLAASAGSDDLTSARRSPAARRDEIEGLIGFFVNTLVLRCGRPAADASASLLAGCGRGARRLHPPGSALREAGRGAGARAQPEPDAALPGACWCCRTPTRRSCGCPA